MPRSYDIILFGATGFTGKLVANYLLSKAREEKATIALAGRNRKKLEAIHDELSEMAVNEKPGLIIADANDYQSLLEMTRQGSILMTTAGPFNIYGREVVKAAVEAGTHYLDITGEPLFVEYCRETFHEQAEKNGVCVVNCCGFDSIPADIGTWLTARQLPSDQPTAVRSFFKTNAKFSGGTWRTAILSIHNQQKKKKGSTSSRGEKHPDTPKLSRRIHKSSLAGRWAIPMPVVDHYIVRHSAASKPEDYGHAFAYAQFFTLRTFWKVLKLIIPLSLIFPLIRFSWTRNWLLNKITPGEGPDPQTRANSSFEISFFGEAGEQKATTYIAGKDPGYDETAKMFSQSAFTILEKMRQDNLAGGVLTPVQALGQDLVARLRSEGITITTGNKEK